MNETKYKFSLLTLFSISYCLLVILFTIKFLNQAIIGQFQIELNS